MAELRDIFGLSEPVKKEPVAVEPADASPVTMFGELVPEKTEKK